MSPQVIVPPRDQEGMAWHGFAGRRSPVSQSQPAEVPAPEPGDGGLGIVARPVAQLQLHRREPLILYPVHQRRCASTERSIRAQPAT